MSQTTNQTNNSNPLILNMSSAPICPLVNIVPNRQTGSSNCFNNHMKSTPVANPFVLHDAMHTRVFWDSIHEDHFKGMNHMVNINPDPYMEYYTHDLDKKTLCNKLKELINYSKNQGYIDKCTFVYERGNGKIHFHGMVKTKNLHNKELFVKEIYKHFNHRPNCKHRTLVIKHIRTVTDRTNYLNYMKKETQNKLKCYYTTYH